MDLNGILKVQDELKAAEKKASDAESEVTNCNKKILQMEEELDSVTEKLNSSITKVIRKFHFRKWYFCENDVIRCYVIFTKNVIFWNINPFEFSILIEGREIGIQGWVYNGK